MNTLLAPNHIKCRQRPNMKKTLPIGMIGAWIVGVWAASACSRLSSLRSCAAEKSSISLVVIKLIMFPGLRKTALGLFLFAAALGPSLASVEAKDAKGCKFIGSTLQFVGSAIEQAGCLLTPVKPFAHLGKPLSRLPAPLSRLVGKPLNFTVSDFRGYLKYIDVKETDLGGSLGKQVSRARGGKKSAPMAKYFVLHDTSAPNFKSKAFPSNINNTAKFNNLLRLKTKPGAHVYVNRRGESRTINDFRKANRATGREMRLGRKAKGLFLHVEFVQPRRSHRRGKKGNDAMAPTPGFTDAQLERLALVYITASVRRGTWLIPAYHAVLSNGLKNGHDDPQNFDLESWSSWITTHLNGMKSN